MYSYIYIFFKKSHFHYFHMNGKKALFLENALHAYSMLMFFHLYHSIHTLLLLHEACHTVTMTYRAVTGLT